MNKIMGYYFGGEFTFEARDDIDGGNSTSGIIINSNYTRDGFELIIRTKFGTLLYACRDEIKVLQNLSK